MLVAAPRVQVPVRGHGQRVSVAHADVRHAFAHQLALHLPGQALVAAVPQSQLPARPAPPHEPVRVSPGLGEPRLGGSNQRL